MPEQESILEDESEASLSKTEHTYLQASDSIDIIPQHRSEAIQQEEMTSHQSINQLSNAFSNLNQHKQIELIQIYVEELLESDSDYSRKRKSKEIYTANETFQDLDVEIDDGVQKHIDEQVEGFKFDVTCTPQVKSFLLSSRSHYLVRKVASIIRDLANGRYSISKTVQGSTVKIEEARLNKGSRLLWRYDPTYSPLRKRYCNVIQILDVVLDHDKISKAIKMAENWIEQGMSGGNIIKLKCIDTGICDATETSCTTSYFEEIKDDVIDEDDKKLVKSILMRDDGGVIPSFSLSEMTIKSLLNRARSVFGLPLKVSREEDEIISLKDQEEKLVDMAYHVMSCICIGRSGTGKTTCCLMRLANEFLCYWKHLNIDKDPVIPRQSLSHVIKENEEVKPSNPVSCDDVLEPSDKIMSDSKDRCDHLHQVFVTKSPHLCSQVQQKFHEIISSEECVCYKYRKHWSHKRLTEFQDDEYPLFITSRDFYILLDFTIGGELFFKRKDDGSLAIKIINSEYLEGIAQDFIDTNYWSESSSESEYESDSDDQEATNNELPDGEWTEIGMTYFTETIWPCTPNYKELRKKGVDPTFAWQEIKSFIKGSVEALMSESGCLDKHAYFEYGSRKAPSFTGLREEIYTCFEYYAKACKCDGLFDECDLVYHIYKRLKQTNTDLNWVVHNFYIDEVQDFTEAELFLLLSCSRCPNGNFLSGDTAQSIMKGVSFRFKDVRSLFHHLGKKHENLIKVAVPDIYKLTVNYRSQIGILRLADSVLELLEHFFPDSFDNIKDDNEKSQALPFEAQKPMVVKYTDISELGDILRGSKSDMNTQIDFGAHQAVIVQSDETKQCLPDVLKGGIALTVSEAKGLEFDDVLLYNFFSDSKVIYMCTNTV